MEAHSGRVSAALRFSGEQTPEGVPKPDGHDVVEDRVDGAVDEDERLWEENVPSNWVLDKSVFIKLKDKALSRISE